MNQIKIALLKAFTDDKCQGNPAGVILNADALSDEEMTYVAKEVGFSESVFVQKSNLADFKLRFFSSLGEVNLCGHATLSATHYIKEKGLSVTSFLTFETNTGIIQVNCSNKLMSMRMPLPTYITHEVEKAEVAKLFNLNQSELLNLPIEIISTGTPKLLVGIASLESLFSIRPDFEAIKEFSLRSGSRGIYAFTPQTMQASSDFHARQFNPIAGINEDPVTGVAAAALGAYVKKHGLLNKKQFIVEQGHVLNKFGKIFVNLEDGIEIGGFAVTYGEVFCNLDHI